MTWKPTQEELAVVDRMAGAGVPVKMIAAALGISRQTLYNHCRERMDAVKGERAEQIGGKLFQKAMDGDTASLIFYAKTQMGWRETVRQEHAGDPDNPVVQRVERVIVRPEEQGNGDE